MTANEYLQKIEKEYGYTHEQMEEAFKKLADPSDWKNEIMATMPGELVGLAVAAIKFYTATIPTVSLNINTMQYTVYSIGYRNGPAGG